MPITNPNIGKLVRSLENDLGIGKVVASNARTAIVEYFDSAVSSTWPRHEVAMPSLREAKQLDEQTRVYFFDDDAGCWKMGRVHGHVDSIVFVDLPNSGQASIDTRKLYVRWNQPLADPWEHLAARLTETPLFHESRAGLVAHLIRQRAAACGITALISAPISLEPHQVEVVRRVLTDPMQRYLLADEVGLGKTIEAGVIIRQHVLDRPDDHYVLVLAPSSLKAQWVAELASRCQVGPDFGHRVEVATLEDLEIWKDERPTFLVVDEAHQLARGAVDGTGTSLKRRFEAVRQMSHPVACRNLLLLSATPVLRNEQGFLALLHLLDPTVYGIEDVDSFKIRIERRQELADVFASFTEDQQPFFLEESLGQLANMFPKDTRLALLLENLRPVLAKDVLGDERAGLLVRQIRLHLSETYRLHRRVLRNRRSEDLASLLPGRKKLILAPWEDNGIAQAENLLEQWRARAAAELWGREDSEECRAMANVFVILLESLWSDPLAFLACVRSRIARKRIDSGADYGLLTDTERMGTITKTAALPGEATWLGQILELEAILTASRKELVKKLASAVMEMLKKNLRIVCMTTSPAMADDLHKMLQERCPGLVLRHGIGKTQWSERWEQPGPQALVCDARAEEGVNLQGGKAWMLHIDFPLSPNRLEQRMGRLDRFGVGKSITSFGLAPTGAGYFSAWTRCLSEAWQVFSRSIAALQYVVEDEMAKLEQRMFLDGVSAIGDAMERLSAPQGIEQEFRFIRNQDELDSIESATSSIATEITDGILDYERSADSFQKDLERWLVDTLQFVRVGEPDEASPVTRYQFARPERGKRTLLPFDSFRQRFKDAIDMGACHPQFRPPLTRTIVFKRETARIRRIGLARVGNPVIDAVQRHLLWDDRGTSFAMWRNVAGVGTVPVIFFRLDFIIEADVFDFDDDPLNSNIIARQADAAFRPIVETMWLGADLMEPSANFLSLLQRSYQKPLDTNISPKLWPQVLERLGISDWSGTCESVRTVAENLLLAKHNLAELTERCAQALEREVTIAQEQRLSRLQAFAEDRDAERAELEAEIEASDQNARLLAGGIRAPLIRLDAAGVIFLSEHLLKDGVPMNGFATIKRALRSWPHDGVPSEPMAERPHERLRKALLNVGAAGSSDLSGLVRHVLRYEEMHHGGVQKLTLTTSGQWPTPEQWKACGCRLRQVDGGVEIDAEAWEPTWLTILHNGSAQQVETNPFAAVEAEEIRHPRLSEPEAWQVKADPALTAAFTGFTHYLSAAQAETVRAVMLSPPGSTRLIVLPTGGGKSLVGLANALLGKVQTGVALIIVPTIALAFDQVEQARAWRPQDNSDAWHSGLNKAQRKAIRQRLLAGTQRLLFLAPESLRVLKDELLKVAATGWLRSVVVDEAHLISQWGGSFRPEMQLMSATLRQLRDRCPPRAEFRTLLMTATLTAETYADLSQLFGSMETLAAVHLRPEPDYFMARCQTEDEKIARILEALRHAPRPAILYVTKVKDAKQWHKRCINEGWLRSGLVHGESTSAERERAITQWREDQLDLMVATSAFGLGMDKGDVRLVLHACVPETIDRFYQEVGRGGRDGRASVSLMIWTHADLQLASRMSSASLISDELGLSRWQSMWHDRTDNGETSYLNLRTTRPGIQWDSDRNIEWNLRTLLLLARAGVLELHELPSPDLARLAGENDEDYQTRRENAWAEANATCVVRLLDVAPIFESSWQDRVGTYRQQSMQAGALNWQRMEDVLKRNRGLPDVLREVYRVPDAGIYDVSLHPSEVEVPTPPKDLCRKWSLSLEHATRTAINGLLILTYQANEIASYDVLLTQISLLKTLISHGVREIAVPSKWLERSHWDEHRNPVPDLVRQSIEGFIIVRDVAELDTWDRQPDVPRASLVMPDNMSGSDFLYSLNRPLHFLIVPEAFPDPANPSRLIGDVRSNVISLKDFARLLQP